MFELIGPADPESKKLPKGAMLLLAAFSALSVAVDAYLLLGLRWHDATAAVLVKYPVTLVAVAATLGIGALLRQAAASCLRDLQD